MFLCRAGVRRGSCSSVWRLTCSTSGKEYHSSSDYPSSTEDGSAGPPDLFKDQTTLPLDLGIFNTGAAALDAVHSFSGLPWWAVIPSIAVVIKTLLLPVSMRQAKIVRTNMVLWKESYEFVRQREKQAEHRAAAAAAAATHASPCLTKHAPQVDAPIITSQQQSQDEQQEPTHQLFKTAQALHQLQQWHVRLQVFHDLRVKCAVPHPAWFMVNQCLQFPIFIYSSACIRNMAHADWPGMSQEGLLWFHDLTQAAVQFTQQGPHLPMGVHGLLLPLAVTGIMLTSIRLGFKASGAAAKHPSVASSWLSPFLACLPPLLYTLTLASTYLKLQLPQAAVLHWLATSSFTLSLQLGLQSPRVRRILGYTQPGPGARDVDPAVAAQANAIDNADILVVMGAKHAALQRYAEALCFLHRALQLDPQNVRAHYSAGQIHALQHHWHQSEDCYRKCAQLAWDEQSKAQALYCLGVACHQQGRFEEALEAYDSSLAVNGDTSMRPMLVLSRVRALRELGRDTEAEGVAEEFLASDQARSCSPVVVDAIARRGRKA